MKGKLTGKEDGSMRRILQRFLAGFMAIAVAISGITIFPSTVEADDSCTSFLILEDDEEIEGNEDVEWPVSGTEGELEWQITADGVLTLEGTAGSLRLNAWSQYSNYITTAVVKVDGLTDLYGTFDLCSNLTSVDFTGSDMSGVEDISYLFANCSSLKSYTFDESIKDAEIKHAHYLFGCDYALEEVDLSMLNLSSVESAWYMFMDCRSLKVLDLSGVDFSGLNGAEDMFQGCSSLQSLTIPANFGATTQLPVVSGKQWVDESGNVCTYITAGLDTAMTYTTTDITWPISGTDGDLNWEISEDGVLTISGNGDYVDAVWCDYSEYITSAVVNVTGITSTYYMFMGCDNMVSINLSELDTSSVVDMKAMFQECHSLETLDLSGFDTSNVIDMELLLDGCYALTSVDLTGFDTSKVTSMWRMFGDCWSLTELDLSSFITESLERTDSMFTNCENLKTLDLSGFYVPNIEGMSYMFMCCYKLEGVDLTGFNMSNITIGSEDVFSGCYSLEWLKLPAYFASYYIESEEDVYNEEDDTYTTYKTIGCNAVELPYEWDEYGDERIWANANGEVVTEIDATLGEEMWYYSYAWYETPDVVTIPEKTDLSAATVSMPDNLVYTGTSLAGQVSVVLDGVTLTKGRDFTVTEVIDQDEATCTVTVTGVLGYTGTITKTYDITIDIPDDEGDEGYDDDNYDDDNGEEIIISDYVLACQDLVVYNGQLQTPVEFIAYSDSGELLIEGEDYRIVYSDNLDAGYANYEIEGLGNYVINVAGAFEIIAANISDYSATLSSANYTYDGSAKTPSVTVKDASGNTVSSSNYDVEYEDNTNAGTATVTITGKNNYTGTLTKTFTISKASQTVTASAASTSIKAGKTTTITASGKGTITYTSSDTSIATVSSKGVVTGQGAGKVTITVKAAGNGNYKSATKTLTITVGLSAPTISSVKQSNTTVTVKWSKVTGASGYYVYRSTSKNGKYSKVKTITGGSTVSYKDTASKKNGTTYYYKVYAYSGSTKSSASSVKSLKYMKGSISSLTNTSKGITVKWSKVSGATGYYVYRKAGSGSYSKVKTITSASTVSWTDTSVKSKNGTTYTYYVQPYNKTSKGAYATTKTVRLTAVSISSVTNSASKTLTVKYKKNSKASGYQIQYSTSSSFSSSNKTVTVSGASTLSKKITSLTKGKTYYVRVRAYKTVSGTKYYSAWSSKKSKKINK